jgi:hypothetical protein
MQLNGSAEGAGLASSDGDRQGGWGGVRLSSSYKNLEVARRHLKNREFVRNGTVRQ